MGKAFTVVPVMVLLSCGVWGQAPAAPPAPSSSGASSVALIAEVQVVDAAGIRVLGDGCPVSLSAARTGSAAPLRAEHPLPGEGSQGGSSAGLGVQGGSAQAFGQQNRYTGVLGPAEGYPAGVALSPGIRVYPSARMPGRVPARGPSQGVQLTLQGDAARRVVEADVLVHGWAATTSATPVAEGGSRERTESFTLKPGAGEREVFQPTLWVKEMVSVRWIEVTRLRYEDGTEWRESAESRCRVRPGLLELVAESR